jgi:hypothetical protein
LRYVGFLKRDNGDIPVDRRAICGVDLPLAKTAKLFVPDNAWGASSLIHRAMKKPLAD